MVEVGQKAPDFLLLDDAERNISLANFAGKPLVIYFYPKDDTPGCTTESIDFSEMLSEFDKHDVKILGISPDDTGCHQRFKQKHNLQLQLLADVGHRMAEAYGVWVEKSMFGKKYMGLERATFLLNAEHKVIQVWHKVKVPNHAKEVLKAVQQNFG